MLLWICLAIVCFLPRGTPQGIEPRAGIATGTVLLRMVTYHKRQRALPALLHPTANPASNGPNRRSAHPVLRMIESALQSSSCKCKRTSVHWIGAWLGQYASTRQFSIVTDILAGVMGVRQYDIVITTYKVLVLGHPCWAYLAASIGTLSEASSQE